MHKSSQSNFNSSTKFADISISEKAKIVVQNILYPV